MARRKIIQTAMAVQNGLATNLDPTVVAGKALVDVRNMGWYERFQALGKLAGTATVARNPDYPSPSVCGGLFEYQGFTPSGAFVRDQIADFNGDLYLIDGDPPTQLDLPEGSTLPGDGTVARTAVFSNRLHITGPTMRDLKTGMLGWDGESMRDVGVLAPGDAISLYDPLDDDNRIIVGTGVLLTEVTLAQLGAGSLEVDKTGTSLAYADIQLYYDIGSLNFSTAGRNLVYVYVYLPSDVLPLLDPQIALEIRYGTDTNNGYHSHHWSPGMLNSGWNLLSMDTSNPSATFGTAISLAAIKDVRFRVNASEASVVFNGVLWNYLHTTDPGSGTAYKAVVYEGLNDTGSWSPSTDVTLSIDTVNTIDGQGSVLMNKTGTTQAFAYMDNTDGYNWSAVGGHVYLYLYVTPSAYSVIASSGTAVQIAYGNNGFTNYNAEIRTRAELTIGWNFIDINLTSPDGVGGLGATLSTIQRIRLQFYTNNITDKFSGACWDVIHTRTLGTEVVSGSVNGNVSYAVTFVNDRGDESNRGLASNAVSTSDDFVVLASVPVSSQANIVERRIYRDLDGDEVFEYAGSLLDNVQTVFFDITATEDLVATLPPERGSSTFDNGVPGRFYDIVPYANRIIGIDADRRNVLRVSSLNNSSAWRLIDELTGTDQLNALEVHGSGVLVYGSDATYLLDGDGVSRPFSFQQISNTLGTNNWRSVAEVKGSHFLWHENKAYIVANATDPWYISGPVQDLFDQYDRSDETTSFVLHDTRNARVLFIGVDTDGGRLMNFWQYGTQNRADLQYDVDPLDLRQGNWGTLSIDMFPNTGTLADGALIEPDPALFLTDGDTSEVWIQEVDGIYALNLSGEVDSTFGFDDDEEAFAVNSSVTFASIPLGYGPNGRGQVRYLCVDAYSLNTTTWTVTIDLLTGPDGAIITTITSSVVLPSGHSSPVIALPGGDRGSWARVTLSNATIGGTGLFKDAVMLHHIPRTTGSGLSAV